MAEKNILCYGDSNTWGFIPNSGARLQRSQRWTGVMQVLLGSPFHVIEEGLNGRTTVWDEPFREGRNGLRHILPLVESHSPLDLVIVMLGTNDMKHHLNVSPHESCRGLTAVLQAIQKSAAGLAGAAPKILFVAPVVMGAMNPHMQQMFEGSVEKSKALPRLYRQSCRDLGVPFLDANDFSTVGEDGVHLNAAGHQSLARALVPVVRDMLA